MHQNPLISVVMPSFNQKRFVEDAIESVLQQEYERKELVVIDGGSTDGTVDVLRKYDRHIAYWVSESDSGQSSALNKGFRHVNGEILGWLNSDDVYMPGAFSLGVETFRARPGASVVFGDHAEIDECGDVLRVVHSFDFSVAQLVYEGFHCNAQAMLWKRDLMEEFGEFDMSLHRTMDYDMILRFGLIAGDDGFARVPEVLGGFRRHGEQKTRGVDERVLAEHRAIAERYGFRDKYTFAGKVKRAYFRGRRGIWYARRGGVGYALKMLLASAMQHRGSSWMRGNG